MTKQEILESTASKTAKMVLLFELGMSRKEVAEAMNCGYGFIQNVFAKTYPDRVRSRTIHDIVEAGLFSFVFNHKFGIEIEAFGIEKETLRAALIAKGIACQEAYRSEQLQVWKITGDGSIQGNNSFELVSPILEGEAGLAQLRIVCEVLKAKKARINKTCGLHVHLDATNFGIKDWRNIYRNYATLEGTIDSFMPASRRASNNTYIKSIVVPNWEQKVSRASTLLQLQRSTTYSDRYYKLNTQSYWSHKSCEFRQMAGTIDFDKISNWVKFLARLVEYSKAGKVVANGDWESLTNFCNDDLVAFLKTRKEKLA